MARYAIKWRRRRAAGRRFAWFKLKWARRRASEHAQTRRRLETLGLRWLISQLAGLG